MKPLWHELSNGSYINLRLVEAVSTTIQDQTYLANIYFDKRIITLVFNRAEDAATEIANIVEKD